MDDKNIKSYTKEELLSFRKNGYLTVGDLRNFLDKNRDLSNDAIVISQRVEDYYYTENNWGVYKVGGEHYYQSLKWHEDIDCGKYLDKEQYPNFKEENNVKFTDEDLEEFKDQYSPVWCCVRRKNEDDILFLNLHY